MSVPAEDFCFKTGFYYPKEILGTTLSDFQSKIMSYFWLYNYAVIYLFFFNMKKDFMKVEPSGQALLTVPNQD